MKSKKGFTLVELLAVIAILAILVLIAIPNILNLYRNARENTFVDEVQNIIRTAQQKYIEDSMNSKNVTCYDSKTNSLDIDAKSSLKYKVELSNSGKIISIEVMDNNYQLIKTNASDIKRDDIGNSKSNKTIKSEARQEGTGLTACDGSTIEEGEEVKTKYVDNELHGADPVLGDKMIPVMLSDTGVATYADVYKDEWYNYKSKQWANAVILVDSPSKEYTAGEVITDSDIRAYFVWIPKYKYKLFNMGDYNGLESSQPESQVQEIDIIFGLTNTGETSGECKTPMESGLSQASDATKECQLNDYMTHPAFLSIPSNGFWVGKFETGYNQNENVKAPISEDEIATWSTEGAQKTENYASTLSNKIIVKPNVYSWRYSTVYNYFMSAYNFNRTLDSHMMKNTEWGAVAYLSHSKYGIMDEVRINNNSNFLTGYAADTKDAASSTTANKQWNNSTTGYLASTTGNISGVYDMSGGAWEYVASYREDGNMLASTMDNIIINSSFDEYLDKYSSESTITSYSKRILGDATGELGPFWNNGNYNQSIFFTDYAYFIENIFPWFARGGNNAYTTGAGEFYFNRASGGIATDNAFRLILTPTN